MLVWKSMTYLQKAGRTQGKLVKSAISCFRGCQWMNFNQLCSSLFQNSLNLWLFNTSILVFPALSGHLLLLQVPAPNTNRDLSGIRFLAWWVKTPLLASACFNIPRYQKILIKPYKTNRKSKHIKRHQTLTILKSSAPDDSCADGGRSIPLQFLPSDRNTCHQTKRKIEHLKPKTYCGVKNAFGRH